MQENLRTRSPAGEATSQQFFSRAEASHQAFGSASPEEKTRESIKSSVYTVSSSTSVFLSLYTTLSRRFPAVIPQELPVSEAESPARPGRKDTGSRETQGTAGTHTSVKIFLSSGAWKSPFLLHPQQSLLQAFWARLPAAPGRPQLYLPRTPKLTFWLNPGSPFFMEQWRETWARVRPEGSRSQPSHLLAMT